MCATHHDLKRERRPLFNDSKTFIYFMAIGCRKKYTASAQHPTLQYFYLSTGWYKNIVFTSYQMHHIHTTTTSSDLCQSLNCSSSMICSYSVFFLICSSLPFASPKTSSMSYANQSVLLFNWGSTHEDCRNKTETVHSTSNDRLAVSGTQAHTNINESPELTAKNTKAPAFLFWKAYAMDGKRERGRLRG